MILAFLVTGMAQEEAEALANHHMEAWGLKDNREFGPGGVKLPDHVVNDKPWTFGWHNRSTALGTTNYGTKTIKLSKALTNLNTQEQMEDTIKHEIAHVMAGPAAGHGWQWKEWARKVGANPARVADDAVEVPGKYIGTCPNCGETTSMQRPPRKEWGCAKCKVSPDGTTVPWANRKYNWTRASDGSPITVKKSKDQEWFDSLPQQSKDNLMNFGNPDHGRRAV